MGDERFDCRSGCGRREPRSGTFEHRDHGPLLLTAGRDSAQGRAEAVGEGNHAVRDSVTLPFGNGNSNSNGGIYPIGRVSNPNAIKSLNGRATLSSGTTVAIPFIHPSYLQRSVQVSIAPDGTVNLLVGPEVTVTGGIVEIHF